MPSVTPFQVAQIVMITTVFILDLLTFYDLSFQWTTNMVMFEATVYGTYFLIKLGYLIAVLTDGNFTPPLEAMVKLNGAVLFNVLGLITVITYAEAMNRQQSATTKILVLSMSKGICALIVSVFYYIEIFQA